MPQSGGPVHKLSHLSSTCRNGNNANRNAIQQYDSRHRSRTLNNLLRRPNRLDACTHRLMVWSGVTMCIKNRVKPLGQKRLNVRLNDVVDRFYFGAMPNIPPKLLVDKSVCSRLVKSIPPSKKRNIPLHAESLQILVLNDDKISSIHTL